MASLGGLAEMKDCGAAITLRDGGGSRSTGAAPAALTGTTINRVPQGGGDSSAQQHESCVLEILTDSTLTAAETVAFTLDIEHADADLNADPTGETAGAFANVPASHQPVSATHTITTAGLARTTLRYDLRLVELKKFLRCNIAAPTFSLANASEILNLRLVWLLGGAHKVETRSVDFTPTYDA